MLARLALVLLLLPMMGCGGFALKPDEVVSTPPLTMNGLMQKGWSLGRGHYRVRTTMLLNYRGNDIALTAFCDLDGVSGRVRVVGIADTGPTIFDVEADGSGAWVVSSVERLKNAPGFATLTGGGVRRIFLDPVLAAGDNLTVLPDRYSVTGRARDESVGYVFAGDGRLLQKSGSEGEFGWSVRYCAYSSFENLNLTFPAQIVYHDGQGLGSITLRVESVKRVDDGT